MSTSKNMKYVVVFFIAVLVAMFSFLSMGLRDKAQAEQQNQPATTQTPISTTTH